MTEYRRKGGFVRSTSVDAYEANALLYAIDKFFRCNIDGYLTKPIPGYTLEELNDLRWRLFNIHEHPEEIE